MDSPGNNSPSLLIRAPLSSDYEFETAKETHSRRSSSSSISVKSFDEDDDNDNEEEEGFLSGEDDEVLGTEEGEEGLVDDVAEGESAKNAVLESSSRELAAHGVSDVSELGEDKAVETKDEVVDEKKNEVLGDELAGDLNTVIAVSSVVDTKRHAEADSNGVSDTRGVELPIEKVQVLTSGNVQENPKDVEVTDSKFVEDDKEVKWTSEKDLLAESPEPVTIGVVSDQSSPVVEEPVDSKTVEAGPYVIEVADDISKDSDSEKNCEPVESLANETQVMEHQESKAEGVEVQKDDDDKSDSAVATSVSLGPATNGVKPELESEPVADSGTTPNESAFKLAVDGVEYLSGDQGDALDAAQSADSSIKSEEVNALQEEKVQVLSAKASDTFVASDGDGLDDVVADPSHSPKTEVPRSIFDSDVREATEDEVHSASDYEEEADGSVSDDDNEGMNFGNSGTAEQIMKELMRGSGGGFNSGAESSQDGSQRVDGQIIMDSDEEVDTDEEGNGKELFDSAALAALLKAATNGGPEGGTVTITSQDGSRLFSVERPAGLGSSIRSSKPASQPSRPNIFTSADLMVGGDSENSLSEEEKKKLEKIQLVRVKFLRLINRLGHSPDDAIAAQVLYRMALAAGRHTGQAFSVETAKKTAMQLEAENSGDLDFSLNVLVLGKAGVGKSATINSIFGEEKAIIGAFEPATTTVKEIIGTVGGVKIRVFDTPGLRTSVMEQAFNRKVLSSVKKLTKKFPLDILLYVDRLDTQTRDLNDLPTLKTITSTLGSSIWRSAIVTLTHAASAPPDGPSGSPLSYEVFVAQRSHIVQQSIGQAVGDLRMMNPSLMNPVSLVENHPSCRKNREGQKILPNGQIWRPQLLLLCYSLKVLSEVSSLSKPQDPLDHRKLFGFRVRAPPLPYLLSSLLQSRAHPKLPDDQGGENVDSDIDLEDLSDSDQEDEEDEYDQLPPFKPLRKSQITKLSKDQRKAYFDEYDYRVKLLQKKQWKEELNRMKAMKKKGKDPTDTFDYMGEDAEQENGPAAVPVPLPDMALPPSFDCDSPAYRYRFLEPTSQLLARPVLDTHGWDHDCGYDGVSLEESLAAAGRFPVGVAVQITKDKKEFNIHLDSSVAAKHGENGSTLAGFDIQTIGKQLGYIVRGETKFKNFKKNKTTGGISVTFLGENVATGLKVEDQISIGRRLTLVGSTGAIRSQGDVAYGTNLEARFKEKDFPIGQDQSTLGLSLMKWRGDLALGANLQSQFSIGRSSKMSVRVGLNNKLSGQITVKTSSSEQLQLALVGILPIAISIYRSIWPSAGDNFAAY
ncbi:hypothetical protein IFM89_004774 [Coptis chinensis]|uniref:AIG1-type G domain-containing protein n=1 Tax=Coptis chinensis TaxID=261450 RepID=A0A835HRN6_9MAGN|nr:hypothetical protein IFM89_004774 [Coptis chinensis]